MGDQSIARGEVFECWGVYDNGMDIGAFSLKDVEFIFVLLCRSNLRESLKTSRIGAPTLFLPHRCFAGRQTHVRSS